MRPFLSSSQGELESIHEEICHRKTVQQNLTPYQSDSQSSISKPTPNFPSTRSGNPMPKNLVGQKFLDKFVHRKTSRKPSRFAMTAAVSSSSSSKSELQVGQITTSSLTSDMSVSSPSSSHEKTASRSPETVVSPIRS